MPPKARENPRDSIEKEGRVLLAVSIFKKSEISSIQEACVYNVFERIIHKQLHGITTYLETRTNSHKMTQNKEESLIQWIFSLDQCAPPPQPSHVQEIANINNICSA